MTAPATLTILVDLTGLDADAAHRDGESAALALILVATEIAGPEHAAHMAVGAIGMFAAVLAGVSRNAAAAFLTDLGAAYRRAAEADAAEVRH